MAVADTALGPAATLAGFLQTHFPDGHGQLGLAVSGGGDSMAMLWAAIDLAGSRGIRLTCATVDHGLRPEAAQEAAMVSDLCAQQDIPHETLRPDLSKGSGLQARARSARYEALGEWANRTGIGTILLGHTADDVAESLLMRLARGVGIDGLAAMPTLWRDRAGVTWGRPFLHLTRAELRTWLTERGADWIEDPSNDDPTFERVRVRQQMAALGLEPAALARSAHALVQARTSLVARAQDLAADVLTQDRGDMLIGLNDWDSLARTEPEQLRRLSAALLDWIGDGPPRGSELDRMIAKLSDGAPRATLSGCVISREEAKGTARFRFAREVAACGPAVPLGQTWDGRWRLFPPRTDIGTPEGLTINRLGDDLPADWRATGLPRDSLRASPAVRDAMGELIAAPLAGVGSDWRAMMAPDFPTMLTRERTGFR